MTLRLVGQEKLTEGFRGEYRKYMIDFRAIGRLAYATTTIKHQG